MKIKDLVIKQLPKLKKPYQYNFCINWGYELLEISIWKMTENQEEQYYYEKEFESYVDLNKVIREIKNNYKEIIKPEKEIVNKNHLTKEVVHFIQVCDRELSVDPGNDNYLFEYADMNLEQIKGVKKNLQAINKKPEKYKEALTLAYFSIPKYLENIEIVRNQLLEEQKVENTTLKKFEKPNKTNGGTGGPGSVFKPLENEKRKNPKTQKNTKLLRKPEPERET